MSKRNLVFAFWILFFVMDLLKKTEPLAGNTDIVLNYYLPGLFLWILLTFPVLIFFEWSEKLTLWKRAILLIIGGVIVGTIKVLLTTTILFYSIVLTQYLPKGVDLFSFISRTSLFYFIESFITIWVVLIVLFLVELHEKYKEQRILTAELDKQLANAQLQTLKMQLRPHFLFNANNVISMFVRQGENEKAIEMIAGLSDLLRTSLDREDQQLITLKEELELLKKYLDIELVRFEDRLQVDFDIHEDTEKAMIPNFITQPILENAFKHGVSQSIGKALVKINTQKKGEKLSLHFFNSGPSFSNNGKQKGIGISNTLSRLEQIYGRSYSFDIENIENGVVVKMKIPFTLEDS